jgi:hypothetical protein
VRELFACPAVALALLLVACSHGPDAPPFQGAAAYPPASDPTDAAVADAADAADDASTSSAAAPKLRVLFVGNSYTSTNDLPGWVHRLAAAAHGGPQLEVDALTPGGATFADQWMSTGAVARIAAGGFTHVVLQAQSVEPVGWPASFEMYGEQLVTEVQKSGAHALLYETWARKAGDAVYMESWSGGDPKAMQAGLRGAYANLAEKGGATVAAVGDAWEQVLATHPTLTLFQGDGSHPTEVGTYLAACVFYAVLTGRSAAGLTDHPASLTQADADALAKLAANTAHVR